MKKIIFALCVLWLMWPSGLLGQNAYLGKRFDFYFTPTLNPAWTLQNKEGKNNPFAYDLSYAVGVNAITGKRRSFGAEYFFFKTRYPGGYNVEYESFNSKPTTLQDVEGQGVAVYMRYYPQIHAPLGFYYSIQLNYQIYIASDSAATSPPTHKSSMYGFKLGFGKTYIIKDFITISPGFSSGITFGEGPMVVFKDDLSTKPVSTLAERKIRHMNIINLHLSIGLIPF